MISASDCENGDYYNDMIKQYLYICVSGKQKKLREWIDVKGFRCVDDCPTQESATNVER